MILILNSYSKHFGNVCRRRQEESPSPYIAKHITALCWRRSGHMRRSTLCFPSKATRRLWRTLLCYLGELQHICLVLRMKMRGRVEHPIMRSITRCYGRADKALHAMTFGELVIVVGRLVGGELHSLKRVSAASTSAIWGRMITCISQYGTFCTGFFADLVINRSVIRHEREAHTKKNNAKAVVPRVLLGG